MILDLIDLIEDKIVYYR